ncbi:DUF2809 domain-containing protein [Flavobacterium sp.]|uniref:ribosomal maturation YjgA family protein n=1 Tax=Flavobacterium sp. TaxID=239 RepID=UPI002616C097|nr:DUF2809 domain-containing protein [Flavobacterium sp.]
MQFDKHAFIYFIAFLCAEIAITLWVSDTFIRPYLGDVLVIFLLFYFVKSGVNKPTAVVATACLLFALIIEFLQSIDCISLLGLEHNAIARAVLGTSFAWADIGCYFIGFLFLFPIEYWRTTKNHSK